MRDDLILAEEALVPYVTEQGLGGNMRALLRQQRETWPMAHNGYASLGAVKTRVFEFDGFAVKVQFNPQRITSSAAKVDEKSIRERKCFLCAAHLPAEQRGLIYADDYVILCNPFPILTEHFTIPHKEHRPQRILPSWDVFLALARDVEGFYTVFYNGPRCGASAPDHLHLQAGTKKFMPIDSEYASVRAERGEPLVETEGLRAYAVDSYLRPFVSFESGNKELLNRAFSALHGAYTEMTPDADEPMMNILCSFEQGKWRVIIFPRTRHRPSFYFLENEGRILLSPAAVDVGGVLTTPLEKDFDRLSKDLVIEMFREVMFPTEQFSTLTQRFVQRYRV